MNNYNLSLLKKYQTGLTLVELLVVISIIGLLSTILYASFDESRQQARDKARMASLKELQLAIEQYRAQTGRYPARGLCAGTSPGVPPGDVFFTGPRNQGADTQSNLFACVSTPSFTRPYIRDLTPAYISTLPRDPKFEDEENKGFYYWTDAGGTQYKLMLHHVAETLLVSDYSDPFARCPHACSGATHCQLDNVGLSHTYAVYSSGAECK